MNNLLAPIDFSDLTGHVIHVATAQARAFGAKLWILHVAPPDPDFVGYEVGPKTVRDHFAKTLREEHRKLEEMVEELVRSGVEAESLMVQGVASEAIVDHAERLDADSIVMGSHGFGAVKRALLGSVSEGVLRRAKCPVVVVPQGVMA